MSAFDNMIERVLRWSHERPDRVAYRFLRADDEVASLTWRAFADRVGALAATLQSTVEPGDRALLVLPSDLDFVVAFAASLWAGVIAVPVSLPNARQTLRGLDAIARDADAAAVVTTSRTWAGLKERLASEGVLRSVAVIEVDDEPRRARRAPVPDLEPESVAFLQYTSGSTGRPKGVAVTQKNLVANETMIAEAFSHDEHTIVAGWLPLHHDMGLIGNVLQPMALGASCVLMSPVDFIQSPIRWLRAVSRYRATTSGAPNFAYDLCADRITEEELAGLDLRSWRVAFCGAEPIRHRTMTRFARKFEKAGFAESALFPCYGMAECTLFATGRGQGAGVSVLDLDAAALERHLVVPADSASARSVVGCGYTWSGQTIAIVRAKTAERAVDGEVGEVWIGGDHVAKGYWNNREATARTFEARLEGEGAGPFLRTGDLGFVRDGELFITGRMSEMIIVRGRNYYPHDIELTMKDADAAFHGSTRGAAFGCDVAGAEELVVVQEVRRDQLHGLSHERIRALSVAVRVAIADTYGITPHEVVLVKPGGIPCTTSGKVRRRECARLHARGELPYAGSVLAESLRPA